MTKHLAYNLRHIRPLAVRPPTYPGSVHNPWGFFISGTQGRVAA
jgi:hypothetical protein